MTVSGKLNWAFAGLYTHSRRREIHARIEDFFIEG
jgi:hypothetical protein